MLERSGIVKVFFAEKGKKPPERAVLLRLINARQNEGYLP
jgi:hypothetical protein